MAVELSDSQIGELKLDLLALQQSLEALLVATQSSAQPVKLKDNAGRLSRMDEMHNQSILVANRNLTLRRLKQIAVALVKIEDDNYGFCIQCDEPIAQNRLKAYPEATMCISCKSATE